jgi:hypothetical protein
LHELIVDEAAKILRYKWKSEWKKRTNFEWCDSKFAHTHFCGKTCGNYFADIENEKKSLHYNCIEQLRPGNTDEWDLAMLCKLFKYSSFFVSSPLPQRETRAIDIIRGKRNEIVGHASVARITKADFDRHCEAIIIALEQLGADRLHLTEFVQTTPLPVIIESESSDPRIRLNNWLDKHFIGSNRVLLPNVSELTSTGELNNNFTAIDEDLPRLVLHVKPEDIILPSLQTENITMIVGSRKLMEQGLADGSIQPEINGERWLLALDDNKLSSIQCVVYFDASSRHWKVESPLIPTSSAVSSPLFVASPAHSNDPVMLSPGAAEVLC